jgi:hypothetical protein
MLLQCVPILDNPVLAHEKLRLDCRRGDCAWSVERGRGVTGGSRALSQRQSLSVLVPDQSHWRRQHRPILISKDSGDLADIDPAEEHSVAAGRRIGEVDQSARVRGAHPDRKQGSDDLKALADWNRELATATSDQHEQQHDTPTSDIQDCQSTAFRAARTPMTSTLTACSIRRSH